MKRARPATVDAGAALDGATASPAPCGAGARSRRKLCCRRARAAREGPPCCRRRWRHRRRQVGADGLTETVASSCSAPRLGSRCSSSSSPSPAGCERCAALQAALATRCFGSSPRASTGALPTWYLANRVRAHPAADQRYCHNGTGAWACARPPPPSRLPSRRPSRPLGRAAGRRRAGAAARRSGRWPRPAPGARSPAGVAPQLCGAERRRRGCRAAASAAAA